MKNTLDDFLKDSALRAGNEKFSLVNNKTLLVQVDGLLWARAGSMVAREGNLNFVRESLLEHGFGKMMKRAFTGEGVPLMKVTGSGDILLADQGKQIHIISLDGEEFVVNGSNILTFENGINWDVKMMRKIAGIASGGLFNVHLKGNGYVAITSHGKPIALQVTPDKPIFTDPNATIAWTGNLQPELHTDLQLKSFFGRASGESFQMKFTTNTHGIVIVQPYEEVSFSVSGN